MFNLSSIKSVFHSSIMATSVCSACFDGKQNKRERQSGKLPDRKDINQLLSPCVFDYKNAKSYLRVDREMWKNKKP